MDEPTRRAWSRPELIVLVRSGPEEAVLTVCKTTGLSGPTHSWVVCSSDGAPCASDFTS